MKTNNLWASVEHYSTSEICLTNTVYHVFLGTLVSERQLNKKWLNGGCIKFYEHPEKTINGSLTPLYSATDHGSLCCEQVQLSSPAISHSSFFNSDTRIKLNYRNYMPVICCKVLNLNIWYEKREMSDYCCCPNVLISTCFHIERHGTVSLLSNELNDSMQTEDKHCLYFTSTYLLQ